jgi:hypothetical protein
MIGGSDSNRREGQGGGREALSAKEVRIKRHDRRNTNRQRGRVRAMSVLGNAKSKSHRKTHQVEPDGTGRTFMHLTRGGLRGESCAGVSRGRSSKEAAERRAERRAKEPRESSQPSDFAVSRRAGLRNNGALQLRQPPLGEREADGWIADLPKRERRTESRMRAKGGGRRCSMK